MERAFWRTSRLGRYREDESGPKKLTALQLAAIDRAIQELDSEPFSEAIYDATEVLVEAGWTNARQLLDLTTGFDVVPARMLAQLRGQAMRLAFLAIERERHALAVTLERSVAEGLGASETAAAIRETFAEGYHVGLRDGTQAGLPLFRRIPTKTWSEMVARTELSRAANAGTMGLYRDAGVKKVRWSATNGSACCDECSDADDEVVEIGDAFPYVDVDAPPAHPRCCCGLVSADDFEGRDEASQANRDRASRGGYTADEYEQKFGHKHPIDVAADDDE
jgi:hypothetical protein